MEIAIKRSLVQPMIETAISLAKYKGLNLQAGKPNNADGDCALEVVLDQLSKRQCFQSIFEEKYAERDPQFYREKWFSEVENVAWGTNWSVGFTEEEWKSGWEMLKNPRQYEHPLGDLVMPGIAHCIGKDILILNTSDQVQWCTQLVLASSLKGKHATTEIPILVAYDQVHYEGLVPNTEEDIQKSIELKSSLLENAFTEKVNSNEELRKIYNIPTQLKFAEAVKIFTEEQDIKVGTNSKEKNKEDQKEDKVKKKGSCTNKDSIKVTEDFVSNLKNPETNIKWHKVLPKKKVLSKSKIENPKKEVKNPDQNNRNKNMYNNLDQDVMDVCKV